MPPSGHKVCHGECLTKCIIISQKTRNCGTEMCLQRYCVVSVCVWSIDIWSIVWFQHLWETSLMSITEPVSHGEKDILWSGIGRIWWGTSLSLSIMFYSKCLHDMRNMFQTFTSLWLLASSNLFVSTAFGPGRHMWRWLFPYKDDTFQPQTHSERKGVCFVNTSNRLNHLSQCS